tara:strand:- start:52597 stop:53154 length:558 start_codon:yes stop_codon:yes gene_type:complete
MANYGITGSDLLGTPANLSADVNQRQPSNTSYLSPTSFRFYIGRVPAVTYFCQAANIPSIDLPELTHANAFADVKEIGSKPEFGELTVRFIVDEDMVNWREIYDWMKGISNFEDFRENINPEGDHKSDTRLVVLTGSMNANLEVTFKDCFPKSIGAINFDSAISDLEYVTCEVVFGYDTYEITKL